MTYNERRVKALGTMAMYETLAREAAFAHDELGKAAFYAQLGILRGLRELLETEQME